MPVNPGQEPEEGIAVLSISQPDEDGWIVIERSVTDMNGKVIQSEEVAVCPPTASLLDEMGKVDPVGRNELAQVIFGLYAAFDFAILGMVRATLASREDGAYLGRSYKALVNAMQLEAFYTAEDRAGISQEKQQKSPENPAERSQIMESIIGLYEPRVI